MPRGSSSDGHQWYGDGGGLPRSFAYQWLRLIGDCHTFQILRNGMMLDWDTLPPLTKRLVFFCTRNTTQILQQVVDKLLLKGEIEPVYRSETKSFFSRLFLVPNKEGCECFVIDLSRLNSHPIISWFKIETQASIRSSIRQSESTVSIDVQASYRYVPLARVVRKYLCFMVNGCIYQFTCLPFGLARSPLEYTKLLRPMVQLLWLWGVPLLVYLDDSLIEALFL